MDSTIALTQADIQTFCEDLRLKEYSTGTIKQYQCSLNQLWNYLPQNKQMSRDILLGWKKEIMLKKAVRTVNSMIAAVNAFLEYAGQGDLKLKAMKCQRKAFSEDEITHDEFQALVAQAQKEGDEQMVALLYAMSGSGVRVSEVQFLTVEAARQRMAVISLKGKTRCVPLGNDLCVRLLAFARTQGIRRGSIFLGRSGAPLDRRRIWERMKRLCVGAGVDPQKVHPHALRHLFARLFYNITHDIAKLADVLGHTSIETTRIYIVTSSDEHRTILDCLARNLGTKKPLLRSGRKRFRT